MKHTFFLENRLLKLKTSELSSEFKSQLESSEEGKKVLEALDKEVQKPINEIRNDVQTVLDENKKTRKFFSAPIGGISNLVAPNASNGVKMGIEAVTSLAFSPYLAYNIGRVGLNTAYNTITSNPVVSISKWTGGAIMNLLGRLGRGIKRPLWNGGVLPVVNETKSALFRTLHWASGLPGDILSLPGAAVNAGLGAIKYLASGALHVAGTPLRLFDNNNIVTSTAKTLSASGTENWKNAYGASLQNTAEGIGNFAMDTKYNLIDSARGIATGVTGAINENWTPSVDKAAVNVATASLPLNFRQETRQNYKKWMDESGLKPAFLRNAKKDKDA